MVAALNVAFLEARLAQTPFLARQPKVCRLRLHHHYPPPSLDQGPDHHYYHLGPLRGLQRHRQERQLESKTS
jgi:hypothetical protein